MTDFVKEFVEENVSLIEERDWFNLFLNWYKDSALRGIYVDTKGFKELYGILEDLGFFTCYEDSASYRKRVLCIGIQENLDFYIQRGADFLHIQTAMEELESNLGFAEHEVKQITIEYIKDKYTFDKASQRIIFNETVY